MKNRQKALSVLLTLAMIAGFLPWATLPVRAAEVPLDEDTNVWTNGKTYKVTSDVNFSGARIQVSGTVSLVLEEGTTLTVPLGIHVPAGATLNISGKGALVIEDGSSYNSSYYNNKAGIGGDNEEACGTVIINGGTITATGGNMGAGIGGGYGGDGGTVTINGGTVNATGGSNGGAGIGGGLSGKGGTVTISGGTVYATGGQNGGAGIGGGCYGNGGTATINGGTVTATGGDQAAGIGGGYGGDNGSLALGESQVAYGGDAPNPTTILNKTATNRPRYMIVKTFSSEELNNLEYATVNGVKSFYKYTTGEAINVAYTVTAADGTVLENGTHYTETITKGGESVQTVQAKGEYTLTITGISPYTSSQTFHFIVSDAIPVTAETTVLGDSLPYCAFGTVTIGSRIAVSSTASLILAEGAKLTVPKGIDVPEGAALNISGSGELVIDGVVDDCAGIGGGGTFKSAGAVNISGGTITVTGGEYGAGIGGGRYGGGGTVTISGGTVTVTGGGQAAGIGGGYNGSVSAVTISGGTVTVTGGDGGAGIGGGNGGAGGAVNISGGTITVTGGDGGAGIGGGIGGAGGTVTVTGGTVYATGGQQCAAVGGTLNLSNVAAGESDDGNNYTALTNNSSKKPYLHFCAPSLTEGVTAPKGAVLVCAAYDSGKMTGVQTVTLAADCIGKAASELLTVPTSGQYKLFLLDGTTYAPLCAAWDNKQ